MNDEQLLRYSRQIMLPEVDIEGQQALADASVLIMGVGGLGSSAAMYLAAAGIGHLILSDHDKVELSNLQRQIIHDSNSLGLSKTESARRTLARLNPLTRVTLYNQLLEDPALSAVTASADVVLDCTDNFHSRFALNRACVQQGKPLVSGATIRFEAQVSVFQPGREDSPCYNCLYDDDADNDTEQSCVRSGVLAPMPGIIGSMQALEAMKIILGIGQTLTGKLLVFDGLEMQWNILRLKKNKFCRTCGT